MGLLSVPSFFFALLVLTGFEPAGTTVAASSVLRPQLIVLRFKRTGRRLAADTACPFIAYTSTIIVLGYPY
jgi:hypothetical protein